MSVVMTRLQRLVDTDPATCATADELATLVDDAQGVRAFIDAYDQRIARRAATFAADGTSGTPTETLTGRGRRRAKDAAAAAGRAELCGRLPDLEAALAEGSVSAGHVDAVARAAKELSEADRGALMELGSELVDAARTATSVEAFERHCRDLARHVADDAGASRHAALCEKRRMRRWFDHDTGMHKTVLELDPESDAKVAAALRAALRDRFDEMLDPNVNWRHVEVDTMVDLITGARAIHPRVPEVSVLIDWRTLVDDVHDTTLAETSDGTPLSPETVRRMACDADIIPIVLGGAGEVLDEGRARRLATPAQRLALKAMHRTCIMPGCTVPVDDCRIHHVDPWHSQGRTDLDVLVPVCEADHHRLHEGCWSLKLTPDRTLTVTRPDGTTAWEGASIDRTHRRPAG